MDKKEYKIESVDLYCDIKPPSELKLFCEKCCIVLMFVWFAFEIYMALI